MWPGSFFAKTIAHPRRNLINWSYGTCKVMFDNVVAKKEGFVFTRGEDRYQRALSPGKNIQFMSRLAPKTRTNLWGLRNFYKLREQRLKISQRPLRWPIDGRGGWIIVNFHEDSINTNCDTRSGHTGDHFTQPTTCNAPLADGARWGLLKRVRYISNLQTTRNVWTPRKLTRGK